MSAALPEAQPAIAGSSTTPERDAAPQLLDEQGKPLGQTDQRPTLTSASFQQRVEAVARAIIAKPSLLLADEPTGNLHSAQGREIMELFCKLNAAGTTIVQVTHSLENAQYGSRIVELKDGWMVGDERVASAAGAK